MRLLGGRPAHPTEPYSERPFTIVIPTLQRSGLLSELVQRLGNSPLVHEIVIINNAQAPLPATHHRARVIDAPGNIYVNPAWNLGVDQATTEFVGLCNDDVLFDPRIMHRIAGRLRRGAGIVGPASSRVRDMHGGRPLIRRRPVFLPVYERPYAFGTMMFLRRDHYVTIPDDLLVWRGDDYLFRRQARRNYVMYGIDVATHMSTTSSDPVFDSIKDADMAAFQEHYSHDPYRLRYWKEFRVFKTMQAMNGRVRGFLQRGEVDGHG